MALGTAVIVGVGPGLGLALAHTFADAGHPIAMLARGKAQLDVYAAEVTSTGQDARGYVTDASDPDNLRAAIGSAITEMGAPDVLVYSVGVLTPDAPIGGDDQDWVHNTAINVLGARVAADAVLPSCARAVALSSSPPAAMRCGPPRSFPPCRSARPGSALTCKCCTTSWRERACTRPASRSRQG